MLSITTKSFEHTTLKTTAFRFLAAVRSKATLPQLPYSYDELEPAISKDIMETHHAKHHQTYVNNFNVAEEKFEAAVKANDLAQQLALQNALKFNGGGHLNHSIYWENLAPESQGGGDLPKGALLSAIQTEFGSMNNFIEKFNAVAAGVQGSGWCWLGYNKAAQRVEIATSGNQDFLQGLAPLLVIDVWEHAYYLQYKNVRADYLKKVWDVVNWKIVAERFAKAQH
ncbi:superoxide dismutase 2 [Mucor ambiguus]|uniref:Superoxide dismutase n=1 Tax=Mucor ambiguus TaxID=91626 RepID=A0A0C9MTY1_9FUNG|nr:superoxide dismutase 2 [Mucor ambiguus]